MNVDVVLLCGLNCRITRFAGMTEAAANADGDTEPSLVDLNLGHILLRHISKCWLSEAPDRYPQNTGCRQPHSYY